VIIHELGHFFVAKWRKVKVEEFGFGLPPKLFGKTKGETEYTFNLLPFGGFVRLLGEEELEDSADPRNFMSKSPMQRAVILVAGVFMNVLLAAFLYYVFFFSTGFKSMTIPLFFDYEFKYGDSSSINTVVTSFVEDSAADVSGVERGEAIIEIDGVPVYNAEDVRTQLKEKSGVEVRLLLMDIRNFDRELRTLTAIPQENDDGTGVLGVLLAKAVTLDYSSGRNKILSGPMHSYNVLAYSSFTLKELVKNSFETKSIAPVSASVSGPVGIYSVVGGILDYDSKMALLGIVDLAALLSLSLALLNALPFPALDGGRLLFVVIEVIRGGRKVSPKVEATVHKWGMIFLLALIVLVTFKDFRTFF